AKDNSVKLEWTLASSNTLRSMILERSYNGAEFESLNEYSMSIDNNNNGSEFHYADNVAQPTVYYRLKMVSVSGNVEYSNLLNFKMTSAEVNIFKVYPTMISSTATINFSAEKASGASLQ